MKLFGLATLLIAGGIAAFVIFDGIVAPTQVANGHAVYVIDGRNGPFRIGGLLAAAAGVLVLCAGVARFLADRWFLSGQ